jgi:hypothetical protein
MTIISADEEELRQISAEAEASAKLFLNKFKELAYKHNALLNRAESLEQKITMMHLRSMVGGGGGQIQQ